MSVHELSRLGPWRDLTFFDDEWPGLKARLQAVGPDVLPPGPMIFAALERVAPADVRVVILGQDPYPTPGHAHGFAFSAEADTQPIPRSLNNIFKEMEYDINASPSHADLRFWADQGVLLLNSVLTVETGKPGAHRAWGWQNLTSQVLARLADAPRAYLLWGAEAQKTAAQVDAETNLKIETAHPSPLSARRGFFGSRPFSRVNAWLQARGHQAINWAHPPEGT
ncbi:MAG: uracil-DNA glycosylase [Pseudomonadota bacterium]